MEQVSCLPWDQSHRTGPKEGRVGSPKKCTFGYVANFVTKMCLNQVFLDALSIGNISD